MSYQFLDAYGSVLTADSSFVSGVIQRPIVNIGSTVGVSLSGNVVVSSASIVGGYAEDSAHTSGDVGLFTLGVRNDAISSLASANLEYVGLSLDSSGRTLIKPFAPNEALVQGVSSTVNINPSSLIAGAGAGLRNYLTDILVSNTGSVATSVSFRDGDGSVIGRTIAPANSGSNIHLSFPMRTGGFNQPIEFTAQTAVSILSVSAYGYKGQ